MRPPPDEIGKGDPGHKVAPNASPQDGRNALKVYRCDSRSASGKPARLIHDGDKAARVLQNAVDDVRQHAETLPLWALRLAQHVGVGTYGYQQVWTVLGQAAVDGGASEAWTDRMLYRGFADAMTRHAEPMPLTVLVGGLY